MIKAVTFDLWGTLMTEAQQGKGTRMERIRRIEEALREAQLGLLLEPFGNLTNTIMGWYGTIPYLPISSSAPQ